MLLTYITFIFKSMNQRRQEIKDHKDMLRAQIKSANDERQTVRYESTVVLGIMLYNYI